MDGKCYGRQGSTQRIFRAVVVDFFLIIFLPLHFGRHVLQDGRSGKTPLVYYS